VTYALGRRSAAMFGILAAACLFVHTTPADAQANPRAEVLVIQGTNCTPPVVDPAIGPAPQGLKYNCFKLLDKKTLPLSTTQPSTMTLPNGRTFQINYGGTIPPVPPDKQSRYRVKAAISKPDGPGFLPLAEISAEAQKRFFVGGFPYQDGGLVLAITILP
jgi:hypothetical protein